MSALGTVTRQTLRPLWHPPLMGSGLWQGCLQSLNIEVRTTPLAPRNRGELLVTNCCESKTAEQFALPRDFYCGPEPRRFFKYVERMRFRYGILSAKYGLHWDDEF